MLNRTTNTHSLMNFLKWWYKHYKSDRYWSGVSHSSSTFRIAKLGDEVMKMAIIYKRCTQHFVLNVTFYNSTGVFFFFRQTVKYIDMIRSFWIRGIVNSVYHPLNLTNLTLLTALQVFAFLLFRYVRKRWHHYLSCQI